MLGGSFGAVHVAHEDTWLGFADGESICRCVVSHAAASGSYHVCLAPANLRLRREEHPTAQHQAHVHWCIRLQNPMPTAIPGFDQSGMQIGREHHCRRARSVENELWSCRVQDLSDIIACQPGMAPMFNILSFIDFFSWSELKLAPGHAPIYTLINLRKLPDCNVQRCTFDSVPSEPRIKQCLISCFTCFRHLARQVLDSLKIHLKKIVVKTGHYRGIYESNMSVGCRANIFIFAVVQRVIPPARGNVNHKINGTRIGTECLRGRC
mmetsp:Transcript_100843/g.185125  ORF Transcript_100843/g.185125 Transcript_100843/m.185125 type:complete len:266 (-) Transcript_100843:46-843(-)